MHMKNSVFVTLCLLLVSSAWANDYKFEFSLGYEKFVELIKPDAWEELGAYESRNTKCGF